jgi:hypothetical protein
MADSALFSRRVIPALEKPPGRVIEALLATEEALFDKRQLPEPLGVKAPVVALDQRLPLPAIGHLGRLGRVILGAEHKARRAAHDLAHHPAERLVRLVD